MNSADCIYMYFCLSEWGWMCMIMIIKSSIIREKKGGKDMGIVGGKNGGGVKNM